MMGRLASQGIALLCIAASLLPTACTTLPTTTNLPTTTKEPAPRFGPIELGMPLEQVRKLLRPNSWGEGWTDRVKAKDAIEIDGVMYDIEYVEEAWNRVTLSANHRDATPITPQDCRARIDRFISSQEDIDGPYTPAPPLFKGAPKPEIVAVGKSSQAALISPISPLSKGSASINAKRTADFATKLVGGAYWQLRRPGDLIDCSLHVHLELTPPRPPQGFITFEDLNVVDAISIGIRHHSLDDAPKVPSDGVEIELECTIDESKPALKDCRPTARLSTVQRPFLDVALKRAGYLSPTPRSRSGRWTPGERTRTTIRIAADDRRLVGPANTAKSAPLRPKNMPDATFQIPQAAAKDPNGSWTIEVGCVVQSDGSLICEEFNVDPPELKSAFVPPAKQWMAEWRFDPKGPDGESAVGAGFSHHIRIDCVARSDHKGPPSVLSRNSTPTSTLIVAICPE